MGFDTKQDSYRDFRNILAERSDAVVAWVGAGLSAPAGLPTWRGLREALVDSLERLASPITDSDEHTQMLEMARNAAAETNLWDAFSLLKDKLGTENFRASVRRALSAGETAPVPSAYKYLWRLRISGVLNLNLDRLAARGFNETYPTRTLHKFTGDRAGDFVHLLRSPNPWLAYLHGETDDAQSWVFTSSDLRRLFKTKGYRLLINTCFAARTVIFVGMSADDIAAGGHLEALTSAGIDLGGHYWITHRGDSATREWASRAGIRLIQYSAVHDDHSELLDFFNDLQQFVPQDDLALPVSPSRSVTIDVPLPSVQELQKENAAAIRRILNAHAASLLVVTTDDTIAKFDEFARKYSPAIYRAWYVSTDAPDNELLGHTVTEQVAEGAFGTVYRGQDTSGNQVAIKVLHEKVRKNHEMLHTFRRGVRSMKILTESGISGVVKYHNASEIPAMVIMDFVEGSNLGLPHEWWTLS